MDIEGCDSFEDCTVRILNPVMVCDHHPHCATCEASPPYEIALSININGNPAFGIPVVLGDLQGTKSHSLTWIPFPVSFFKISTIVMNFTVVKINGAIPHLPSLEVLKIFTGIGLASH